MVGLALWKCVCHYVQSLCRRRVKSCFSCKQSSYRATCVQFSFRSLAVGVFQEEMWFDMQIPACFCLSVWNDARGLFLMCCVPMVFTLCHQFARGGFVKCVCACVICV